MTKLASAETGTLMSLAFICFGVGIGMLLILSFGRKSKAIFDPKRHLQRKDTWKIISLILLSFLANTLILIGLKQETAAAGSILQNVSTVATVIFAALFLHEKIPKRLGIGAGLIVLGSFALSITNAASLSFSTGSLFLIGGNIALGASYIVTKLLSERNPIENVICRGFGVSILAFIIAVSLGESLPTVQTAIGLMAVGFLSSGLSTMLLQYGQRHLGAAKAGVIYGTAPVLGVLFAIPLLGEIPSAAFIAALILFIPGMYFVITKNNTAAAKEKIDDPSDEEDTQFFASITERRKTDMRNILTSFGLLAIALYFVMMMLDMFDSGTADAALETLPTYLPGIALGIFTLLCGVILLLLGRRVMAAVTFMIMAVEMLSAAVLNGIVMMNVISGIFGILFAIILMTSKDPQKYAFAIINVLLGFASISCLFNEKVCGWIMAVAAVYLIWLSIACGTEKLRYSIAKYLTKDGDMTFRKCGPVIGYLLISVLLSITLVYGYLDISYFTYSDSVLILGLI
ncbi:MAG TPA: DMT family transporter, partial [Methanocorpusculum sp.]|nr:DMT family transporter [Methanocorpusculum sp.]